MQGAGDTDLIRLAGDTRGGKVKAKPPPLAAADPEALLAALESGAAAAFKERQRLEAGRPVAPKGRPPPEMLAEMKTLGARP